MDSSAAVFVAQGSLAALAGSEQAALELALPRLKAAGYARVLLALMYCSPLLRCAAASIARAKPSHTLTHLLQGSPEAWDGTLPPGLASHQVCYFPACAFSTPAARHALLECRLHACWK